MTVPPPVVPCQCCDSTLPTAQSSLAPHLHLWVMQNLTILSLHSELAKTDLVEELLLQDLVLQVGRFQVELRKKEFIKSAQKM